MRCGKQGALAQSEHVRHWREPEEAAKNIVRSAYKRPAPKRLRARQFPAYKRYSSCFQMA